MRLSLLIQKEKETAFSSPHYNPLKLWYTVYCPYSSSWTVYIFLICCTSSNWRMSSIQPRSISLQNSVSKPPSWRTNRVISRQLLGQQWAAGLVSGGHAGLCLSRVLNRICGGQRWQVRLLGRTVSSCFWGKGGALNSVLTLSWLKC